MSGRPRCRRLSPAGVLTVVIVGLSLLGLVWPVQVFQLFGASPAFGFQYWRPLLFAVSTSGFAQLIAALLAIWLLIPSLERELGWRAPVAICVLSGLGAATALALVGPASSMSGAVCTIFGLLAAQAVIRHREGESYGGHLGLLVVMVGYTLLVRAEDWVGAIGGLMAGAVCGAIWAWSPQRNQARRRALALVSFALVCLVLITATWLR